MTRMKRNLVREWNDNDRHTHRGNGEFRDVWKILEDK
jgi:hypothetical protein